MRSIVAAERTALNFLGHLSRRSRRRPARSSTRSTTVDARVAVLDTRKTTPGLRALEKAAVRAGGGTNHRSSLSESVLLKDNHLGVLGIAEAVARAEGEVAGGARPGRVRHRPTRSTRRSPRVRTRSCSTTWTPTLAAACVAHRPPHRARDVFVEASGRITVETAPRYAAAGVDAVSSGALTHSVRALDLGLDLAEG